ncbi:co-chaperone protein p23-1-like [Vicia villosa]|uniref:co-chaperone protein p23-1-like n=1 Tax=Vicia villosa TaxID=3911 RepID=UPI00273B9484|nr:co-chaperone protein p23-1-like [Vicia villosa]
MSRHPTVKWAQRSDEVLITVELPDAQNVKLKLEPEGKFYFFATAGADKIPYEVDIDLFDKIDVDNSESSASSRQICYLVKKAENKWWDRLLKQGGKSPSFLKVDWDKWIDEDEVNEQDANPVSDMDFGDVDFSKLNMGGGDNSLDFDAAGDDDDDESDSEEEDTEEAEEASSGIELDAKATVNGNANEAPDTKA